MGRILVKLSVLCNLSDIMHVKRCIEYQKVPIAELWRINMVKELIEFGVGRSPPLIKYPYYLVPFQCTNKSHNDYSRANKCVKKKLGDIA